MAVYYATQDDIKNPKLPYLYAGQPGGINLSDYKFTQDALLKKASNNPLAGSAVGAPVTQDSLAPGFTFDPANPTMAFRPKTTADAGASGGFDMDAFLNQFLSGGTGAPSSGTPGVSGNLSGAATKFADIYKPPTDKSDALFQDLLERINAPSSTDEVQRGIETEGLKAALADIDRQIEQDLASTSLDFLDRGLGGPGQYGDIEANARAQVRSGGARTKAGASNQLKLAEIERQKAKEAATTAAYGERYKSGVTAGAQERDIASRGALSDQALLGDLLKTEYQGAITTGEGSANRASTEKLNQTRMLLDYAVESGKMSQQDRQFYDGLLAQAEQNALGRNADYNRTLAGQPQSYSGDPLMDLIIGGVVGGATGGVGTGIGAGIAGLMTKKK